ncbi:hypothetical protein [Labilibaculum euxinus]|uniref:Uncharacterized protein n=1 Tax=Labilibaculum euxinus TaxID=2686357 RepID=A0A7M4DBV4_9BACT|nr:hypothetical protein [Labilibaculum euxinus]MUP40133.1 hypothetical protein [Labilibaculum euxinus]MVB09338.1 hypothetical protein [Labilibaculum euxinus]
MKVTKTIELGNGHKIEFGSATWDNKAISIRNRYPTSTGGFSPRSSSEIPIEDIKIMTSESIKNGYLNQADILAIKDVCNKKSPKKNILIKLFSYFEIIGIFLILVAFGWQQFETDSATLSYEVDLYQTHDKLDAIWGVIADDYAHRYSKDIKSQVSTDFDSILANWKYWGRMKKEKVIVDSQRELARSIRIFLYVLGSLMVLTRKYYDINDKTMPNKSNRCTTN